MSTKGIKIHRYKQEDWLDKEDILAMEEPLELRLAWGKGKERRDKALAITMRTPGQDEELALGFLFTEGIIQTKADVLSVKYPGLHLQSDSRENILLVELHPRLDLNIERLNRHFYTSSSCGVCGKASIELVQQNILYIPKKGTPKVSPSILGTFPNLLKKAQDLFEQTGGIHAAGLFRASGQLLLSKEDVGRHNALDKLIGAGLHSNLLPMQDHILLVSGRASFELVQKALMAGISFLAAVGAPSSLAVELAQDYGMTLVGFLRADSFNVYNDNNRILS